MRFDHIIIAVSDLEQAQHDFRKLGFTVFYGGRHAGGETENALITMVDGGYLELIAPTDPANPPASSPYLGRGGGFAGYALHCADLAAEADRLAAAHVPFEGPNEGGRQRTDGQQLIWQTLFPADAPNRIAPFLIADKTPRGLRVPQDPALTRHANAVTGAAGVVVAVADLDAASARYMGLLDVEPRLDKVDDLGPTVAFDLDGFTVTLATGQEDGDPLSLHLDEYGETPYLLQLRTSNSELAGMLDRRLAHDTRIELVAGN